MEQTEAVAKKNSHSFLPQIPFLISFSIFTLCLRLFVMSSCYCVQPLSGQFTTQPKHRFEAVHKIFRFHSSKQKMCSVSVCVCVVCLNDFSCKIFAAHQSPFSHHVKRISIVHKLCRNQHQLCWNCSCVTHGIITRFENWAIFNSEKADFRVVNSFALVERKRLPGRNTRS